MRNKKRTHKGGAITNEEKATERKKGIELTKKRKTERLVLVEGMLPKTWKANKKI